MTNTTTHTHIARTRRLGAVATLVVALGMGALAVNSTDSAGANPPPARPAISGTPTATTAAPAN